MVNILFTFNFLSINKMGAMNLKKLVKSSVVLSLALSVGVLPSLHAEAATPQISYNKETKGVDFISEKWTAPKGLSLEEKVHQYLSAKKNLLKISNGTKSRFVIKKVEKDQLGFTHVRLSEVYKGVPVYGSEQTLHIDSKGTVQSYFGTVVSKLNNVKLDVKPTLSQKQALDVVVKDLQKEHKGFKEFAGAPETQLVVFPQNGQFSLAYFVKASVINPEPGYHFYFVDAKTGAVLEHHNGLHEATATGTGKGVLGDTKTFNTDYVNGTYYLRDTTRGGGIETYNANNAAYYSTKLPGSLYSSVTSTFSDPAAVDAHAYAGVVYDYFKNTFGRNSYDGQGAKIISSVHVGRSWNNAAWIGTQMVYGDGDGTTFTSLSGSLDVIGHELAHAVTEKTADLVYQNESGALNESISDIFGAMVDPQDWLIGEDIYTPNKAGDALRSMADPTLYGDPDHYSKRYTGTQDNGGVHINSGINNKAAYLLSDGGTHYGVTVAGIGRAKVAQIYYRALTYYLTPNSNFANMRQAAIQAATDLYGATSAEVTSVKNAYSAVGVN